MAERVEVKIGWFYYFLMIVLGLPTLGILSLLKQPMGLTQLIFGATTVQVPRISLHRGKEVIAWIRTRLGLPTE